MQRARACFLSAFHSIILSIAQHRFKHRSYRDGLPYTRTLYLSTAPPFKKKETRILFLIINSTLLWPLLKKVQNFSAPCEDLVRAKNKTLVRAKNKAPNAPSTFSSSAMTQQWYKFKKLRGAGKVVHFF
jgi:hypothetical protein